MEDIAKVIMYGLAGAAIGVGFGVFKLKSSSSSKEEDYHKALTFRPEFFGKDLICAQLFLKLQNKINNTQEDFENAGSAADSILCLANELSKGRVQWKPKHAKEIAAYYRKLIENLDNILNYEKQWLWIVPKQQLDKLSSSIERNSNNETVKTTSTELEQEKKRLTERIEHGARTLEEIYDILEDIKQHLLQYVWRLSDDPTRYSRLNSLEPLLGRTKKLNVVQKNECRA